MIFVYPVVCSDNIDNRILPAICKSLEKFYLSNICEAFSSGVLIPKSKWDYSRRVYGPIVLENTEHDTRSVIHETSAADGFGDILLEQQIDIQQFENAKLNPGPGAPANYVSIIDRIISRINQLNNIDRELSRYENQIQDLCSHTVNSQNTVQIRRRGGGTTVASDPTGAVDSGFTPEENRRISVRFNTILSQYRNVANRYISLANSLCSDAERTLGTSHPVVGMLHASTGTTQTTIQQNLINYQRMYGDMMDRFYASEKYAREQQKIKDTAEDRAREEEERQRQQKERDAESYRTHGGSWKMSEVHGIGFDATMATVEVRIQYVGGDYDSRKVYNSDARVNLPVGVKLIPNVVPGNSIRYALLSDAFRSKNDQYLTSFGRSAGRMLIKWGERFVHWLTGRNFDLSGTAGEDEITKQVLYAPQHLINASGFKRRPGSSDFYQFTSGVVILNKEELREIDDLLNDRNFMNRIIHMGWNSICVMDDVGEEALFISTVDGGYIHRLPYAYIFSSIGMTTTYDNIDKLQKHSGPFNRSDGRGFTPFGQKVMKESFAEMFDRIDNERNKSDRGSSQVSLDSDSYYG